MLKQLACNMTGLKEYSEGRTTFLTADVEEHTAEKGQPTTDMPVFYNPRMRINRDLSVLFLRAYMEKNDMKLFCEPLAGSGVRSLRYLNEIPGEFNGLLCDVNPMAIETATKNLDKHGFLDRAQVLHGDAKILLLTESRGKRFDFVDIDPFGSPVPYLNAAIQSLNPRGGLLGLTATDMPALCGVYPRVALRKYGGLSTRAPFTHELAVRLLLGRTYSIAAMNGCSIKPLGILSTDHYIRAWIHIESNKTESNKQVDSIGMIRLCRSCQHAEVYSLRQSGSSEFLHEQENCPADTAIAGPLWIGDLYDSKTLERTVKLHELDPEAYHKRVRELLELMTEEQTLVRFPFMDIHDVCDAYNLPSPKRSDITDVLIAKGYQVSRTHFRPTAIRTDAPVREVVSIIKDLIGE
ncbi:MAG: tRNA (guanine(10)-N(2))-dimethyltransferase [Candidatus Thorarchaeota archaeon]|nr:tRNA (guanine(10)-N(2))-dimethyltransferase [Candidatus Thorarchaeota archaeon]